MTKGAEKKQMKNLTENIIRYESGEMSEAEEVKFFQGLIDTGLCWKLQGSYGRTATYLLEEGLCNER